MLRVHAADDISTRRAIEEVLDSHTKRWELGSDDPGPDNLPTLTYCIRLKKRIPADALLEALRERLAPSSPNTLRKRPTGTARAARDDASPPHVALPLLLAAVVNTGSAQAGRALAHYDLAGTAAWQEELPAELAEISGLAFAPDGQLLAHGDERGSCGATTWRAAAPRAASDSGTAGVCGRRLRGHCGGGQPLFLVTGAGAIYEGRITPDGQVGNTARRIQGLRGACEVEGMTWDPGTRSLLLLCKNIQSKLWKDSVVILAVSPDTWRFEKRPRILVPQDRLEGTGKKGFADPHSPGILARGRI